MKHIRSSFPDLWITEVFMKNTILLLFAALLLFVFGCGKKPQEETKFVILKNEGNLDAQVSFVRGEKTLFSLKTENQVGFMRFMQDGSGRPSFLGKISI